MGTNLPGYNPDALNWLEAHIDAWQANPAAIGLTDAEVAALKVHILASRAAYTDTIAKRDAAQDATLLFKETAVAMRRIAGPLIANIKHFAENSAAPEVVYVAASILPRKAPAPVAPPSRPTRLMHALNGDGSVTLTFEAAGPVGTTWSITRKLESEPTFLHVGFAAPSPKSFTDDTIPAGEKSVTYLVQGVRAATFGPVSSAVLVHFGNPEQRAKATARPPRAA